MKRVLAFFLFFGISVVAISGFYLWVMDINAYQVVFIIPSSVAATVPSSQKVDRGEYAVKPNAIDLNNCYLGEWYLDDTYNNEFSFKTPIHHDLVLYGKFIKKEFTITFDKNGGELSDDSIRLVSDETAMLPLPYKHNYVFRGYSLNGQIVTDAMGNLLAPWTHYANAILKAEYSGISVPVSYLPAPEAEQEGVLSSIEFGSDFELHVPSRTGYAFDGWFIGSTRITYSSGRSITSWSYNLMQLLEGKFTANRYFISYADPTNVNAPAVWLQVEYDGQYSLPALPNLLGWYYNETQLTNSNGQSLTTFNFTHNIFVTPVFN